LPDIFISYSSKDAVPARALYDQLSRQSLTVFLAEISLEKGQRWTSQIFDTLRHSNWFFLLATPNSLKSDAVLQEVGGAIATQKRLVPIMLGVEPDDMPTWLREFQGIKLDDLDPHSVKQQLDALASEVKIEKQKTLLVGIGLVAALVFLSGSK
jgi:hypothetical protein